MNHNHLQYISHSLYLSISLSVSKSEIEGGRGGAYTQDTYLYSEGCMSEKVKRGRGAYTQDTYLHSEGCQSVKGKEEGELVWLIHSNTYTHTC